MQKSILTTLILVLIAGGVGFYGGMQYGQSKSSQSGSQNFARSGGNSGGFIARNGGARRTGAGGNFISGDILKKDNGSIVIQDQNGGSKIVLLSGSTTIGKMATGTADDLVPGERVMVAGSANQDGSITAQTIQIRPENPNGNGNQSGQGAGGAQQGQ